MTRARARRLVGVVAAGLVVGSCGVPISLPTRVRQAPTRTPVTAASAGATSSGSRSALPADHTVHLTAHGSETVDGVDRETVEVTLAENVGVVVRLDCSRCTGQVMLVNPEVTNENIGSVHPLVSADAPLKGEFLTWGEDPLRLRLTVTTRGKWSLRLSDWYDVDVKSGTVTGTGPQVFFYDEQGSGMTVTHQAAGITDRLEVYAITEDDEEAYEDFTRGTRTVDVALPALVAVNTLGSWTLTSGSAPARRSPPTGDQVTFHR